MNLRGKIFRFPPYFLKKYKGVFISGTDTGVGKTVISSIIARYLRKKGVNFGMMKPIETGGRKDAYFLRRISCVSDSIDEINPVYFKKPLAPYVSAALEKKKIDIGLIVDTYKRLCRKHDFLIVEGAGGLLVPVTDKLYIFDLIKLFKLPLIIVSKPGLGAINHTLLSIKYAKDNGIKVLGFILNFDKKYKKGIAERTNPGIIEKFGNVRFLGCNQYINKKWKM